MAQVIVEISTKQMSIVLKHAEDNNLRFEDAFRDIIDLHEDLRTETIAATLKAVVESVDASNTSAGKTVLVPSNEIVSITEVYAMAKAMPMHKPFTIFDVIETMPNSRVIEVTEDQMRGWGTPFSNWVKRNAAQFQVVDGNHNPRQYVRIS